MNIKKEYEAFIPALQACVDQLQSGKGSERHGHAGLPFKDHDTWKITKACGLGFPVGQTQKKTFELLKWNDKKRQLNELVGAANYALMGILLLQEQIADAEPKQVTIRENGRVIRCSESECKGENCSLYNLCEIRS